MELWLFLGGGFVVLVLLAWRNGAFGRRGYGDADGRGAISLVGGLTQSQLRDPGAQLAAGDRLGGRGPGDGRGD